MKLFTSVYLDEDVSVLVAVLLRAKGFDAVTTRDEKMLTQPDPAQLAHAVSLERCILTHNRLDYEQLHQTYISQELPILVLLSLHNALLRRLRNDWRYC